MLDSSKAYSGFAVDDPKKAKDFYENTLGLKVAILERGQELLQLDLAGGRAILVYRKPDFTPATYTILNFPVEDVDATVDELTAKGVQFERYEGMDQDEKGIAAGGEGRGPTIAWFTDPAGNIMAVHEDPSAD
jgi:catechol 2,3-dioxygenase-like lactoylglutathione lyase family enzyme